MTLPTKRLIALTATLTLAAACVSSPPATPTPEAAPKVGLPIEPTAEEWEALDAHTPRVAGLIDEANARYLCAYGDLEPADRAAICADDGPE